MMETNPDGPKVALFGLGLMGASLALALKRSDPGCVIMGFDVPQIQKKARAAGVIDETLECDIDGGFHAEALRRADWVILALPMRALNSMFNKLASVLPVHAVLIDLGSVKKHTLDQADQALSSAQMARYVPCHPMVGKENNGIDQAEATLFEGSSVLLTPPKQVSQQVLKQVRELWQRLGASTFLLDADRHDHIVAANSHLPHLLAYALVHVLKDRSEREALLFTYAGGGLKDFIRIASSSPTMWTDIFMTNRKNLLCTLSDMQSKLARVQGLLENSEDEALYQLIREAQQHKRSSLMVPEKKQK